MNNLLAPRGPLDGDVFADIVNGIERDGYVVVENVFSEETLSQLFVYLKNRDDQLKPAGVGRATDFQVNEFLRRDQILWLEKTGNETRDYFAWIEALRLRLNEALFLGLFDYECHFAYYPEGAFYKKHLDAFRGSSNRRLSTVLYLNPQWNPADGGELAIYQPDGNLPFMQVAPLWGRMVIFLSEVFPHEVLKAQTGRYSLTGWYRINGTLGDVLDPPK